MEYVAISSIIISVIVAIKSFVKETHIKRCHACCFDSDCRDNKKRNSKDSNSNISPITPSTPITPIIPITRVEEIYKITSTDV